MTNFKMWDDAYQNTTTIVSYRMNGAIKCYEKACKNCNSTKYKDTTREMQVMGNCTQRIVICECNNLFIEDLTLN